MNSLLPTNAALNWNCTTHGYMIIEAPPPSQPASSLGGGPPTTSQTPLGGTSGMLLVGVASGITVVLLNVFVIGCCLHKRNEKRLKRGTSTTSLSFPKGKCGKCIVIVIVALTCKLRYSLCFI